MVAWVRGGVAQKNVWPAVFVLKSLGGSAGLFAMPPKVDPENSSPQAQVLLTDLQGGDFTSLGGRCAVRSHDRRKRGHVRVVFLQAAGPELAAANQTFTGGHLSRSNLLAKLLNQGTICEWVN